MRSYAVRIFHPLVKCVKIIIGKFQRVTEVLENNCKTLTDNKENSILFSTAATRCNCFYTEPNPCIELESVTLNTHEF
jgi:hypothetical protein